MYVTAILDFVGSTDSQEWTRVLSVPSLVVVPGLTYFGDVSVEWVLRLRGGEVITFCPLLLVKCIQSINLSLEDCSDPLIRSMRSFVRHNAVDFIYSPNQLFAQLVILRSLPFFSVSFWLFQLDWLFIRYCHSSLAHFYSLCLARLFIHRRPLCRIL